MVAKQTQSARRAFEEKYLTPKSRSTVHAIYTSRSDKIVFNKNMRHGDLEGKVQDVIVAHVTRLPGEYSDLPLFIEKTPIVYVKASRYEPQ